MYIKINWSIFVEDMKNFIVYLHIIILFITASQVKAEVSIANHSINPKYEMRAVWLSTIGGIDWPHSYAHDGMGISRQKAELTDILDKLQHAGINTVLLQTRVRATSIFPCKNEPWDGCLSGKPGMSPGYDALRFAIDECHKRGMQLHAWIVTIPVGKWNGAGCKNLRNTVPGLLKKIGEDGFMDPENPATGDYLARYCADITRRYDIDGIHLDYIRYPETWGKISNKNKGRQNITDIVRKIHDAVKAEKQWVMMSCSPVGKYNDLPRYWSHGWNAYDIVCQDAQKWLKDDLMDALFPMMYFRGENFYPFAFDWQERSSKKIIAPGLGIYFMSPKEKEWPLMDITREMYTLRQIGSGFCMFRSKFFTDNTKGIYDFTAQEFCRYKALIPPMNWYGFKAPEAPDSLTIEIHPDETATLTWPEGKDNSDALQLHYNVYASTAYPTDVCDVRNLIASNITQRSLKVLKGYNYAVTSIDRYGNESTPTQLAKSLKLSQLRAKLQMYTKKR